MIKQFSLLFCGLLLLLSTFLSAQCLVERNIPLLDNDTTYISILVNGLSEDSLGVNGQGLCGVKMNFRHEFVGDISMELISPSGQKVRLVGPAVPVSGNTSFTKWNVTFVSCGDIPSPDAGFSPSWDNLQPWGIFGNYSGQYHPFLGCLEDFNSGNSNGTWTLRIIDVSQFGSGQIQSVSLFFCDDTGLDCDECKLDPGDLQSTPVEQCQTSGNIIFQNLLETFTAFPKDTVNYIYKWALFQDSVLLNILDQGLLSDLAVGTFTLCNLQYAKNDSLLIPVVPDTFDIFSLNSYFENNFICAQVGDRCIDINIYSSTDTIFIDTTICAGNVFVAAGEEFNNEGTYTLQIPGQFCDTILVLELKLDSIITSIQTSTDSISCINPSVFLTGNISDTTKMINEFKWFSPDGLFLPTQDVKVIEAKSAGTFYFTASDGFCSDTSLIEIYLDENFPQVSIIGEDTLTCFLDTTLLTPLINVPVQSLVWSSSSPFIQIGNSIKVFETGQYSVNITGENGCSAVASINIVKISEPAPFTLIGDTLFCKKDSIYLDVLFETGGNYQYVWSGVHPGNESVKNPLVTSGGLKSVLVTDVRTGCSASQNINIPDLRQYPNVLVNVMNLNCERNSVVPQLIVDLPVDSFIWTGPGFFSNNASVMITIPGTYNVSVFTEEGCFSTRNFFVGLDTVKANIFLNSDSLTCTSNSVIINVESDKELIKYNWYDSQNNLVGSDDSLIVFIAGKYLLQAVNVDGCLSIQTIEIIRSASLPNILFEVDEISCTNDSVQIKPDKAVGFNFVWQYPDQTIILEPSPYVHIPGLYKVTVTDRINPDCVEIQEILVNEVRDYVVFDISYGEFTCISDSVRVMIIPDIDSVSLAVSGPFFTIQNDFDFFVHEVGTYYVRGITKEGCITMDSFTTVLNDIVPNIVLPNQIKITCFNRSVPLVFESNIIGTRFELYRNNVLLGEGNNFMVSDSGYYKVYGIAPNACRDTLSFNIELDTLHPDISILPFDTINCINTFTILEAVSGSNNVNVKWTSSGSNPITVNSGGQYIAEVMSIQNGCITQDTVLVIEEKIYAEYEVSASQINCKNENAVVLLTPGIQFNDIIWSPLNPSLVSPGTLSFNTSQEGVYYFEVISDKSCIFKDSIFVIKNTEKPVILQIISENLNCTNRQTNISVVSSSPIDSIRWTSPFNISFNSLNLNVSNPGEYKIKLFGSNGCIKDTAVTILEIIDPPQYSSFTDSLSCKKGKGIIGIVSSDNIVSYVWSGPNQYIGFGPSVLVTESGTYTVVITKTNGCTDTTEIKVGGDYREPDFAIKDSFFVPCDSSLIRLFIEENDIIEQYYWSFEGNFLSNDSEPLTNKEGNYSVLVTSLNGCRAKKDFKVIQITLPAGFSFTTDTITCGKTQAYLSANSPSSLAEYKWISPNGIISQNSNLVTDESGLFLLIVKDDNKCFDTVEVEVSLDTLSPFVEIDQLGEVICEEKQVDLRIRDSLLFPEYTFLWFSGSSQLLSDPTLSRVTVSGEGEYRVLVTNQNNGCQAIFVYEVGAVESDFTTIPLDISQPLCNDFNFGSASITNLKGVPPYQTSLNGVVYGSTFDFYLLAPGEYNVSVKDSLGCKTDTVFTILPATSLSFPFPADTTLYLGDSLILVAGPDSILNNKFNIIWLQNKDTLCSGNCSDSIVVFPKGTTIYTLQMISEQFNCFVEKKIFVNVLDGIFSGIPNVFSRSAIQSENRTFYIPQTRGVEKIISFKIFDKWANPMFARYDFESGIPELGWDGTFEGKEIEQGVYVVVIELLLTNGRSIQYEGSVTVIK
ncbi:MAG: proprotein convertase P-domain-containing protein [Saprospiraceae bacterium]|nr:proprotein convertase P-domain-containing protein [Saprospiraceae bacterium]